MHLRTHRPAHSPPHINPTTQQPHNNNNEQQPPPSKHKKQAPYVNAKDGLRGLADVGAIRGGAKALETAGTLTVDWQFVPCSYTHDQCATLMRSMGYDNVWTPKRSEGVDSFSLRPISTQRGASGATYDRLFKEPWT